MLDPELTEEEETEKLEKILPYLEADIASFYFNIGNKFNNKEQLKIADDILERLELKINNIIKFEESISIKSEEIEEYKKIIRKFLLKSKENLALLKIKRENRKR
ncbi:MAG: hypothetical protein ACK5XN_34000 [Bacteroidota bacterium]